MPSSAIAGFVKKRTAAQRYKRSPRQLTRDMTVAIAMRDEKVLPHLRIRTEDGEVIAGEHVTPDLVKRLRDEGRNPKWYLRRTWLEETFGRREKDDTGPADSEHEDDIPQVAVKHGPAVGDGGLTEMLKESIKELKQDKEHLTNQLAIKDEQIKQTTERWKESNVLTQNLHKRIDTMEQQMKTVLLGSGDRKSNRVEPVEDAIVIAGEGEHRDEKRVVPKNDRARAKKAATASKTTGKGRKERKSKPQKPKWYEMPTVGRLASRFRSRS